MNANQPMAYADPLDVLDEEEDADVECHAVQLNRPTLTEHIAADDLASLKLLSPHVDDVVLTTADGCVYVDVHMTGGNVANAPVVRYRWTPVADDGQTTKLPTASAQARLHTKTLRLLTDVCPHLADQLRRLWTVNACMPTHDLLKGMLNPMDSAALRLAYPSTDVRLVTAKDGAVNVFVQSPGGFNLYTWTPATGFTVMEFSNAATLDELLAVCVNLPAQLQATTTYDPIDPLWT